MKRKWLFVALDCVAVLLVTGAVVSYLSRPEVLYRVTVLPTMGVVGTCPPAINDSGHVVAAVRRVDDTEYVVLWDKSGRAEDLVSFPKGYKVVGVALNNAGQIAGTVFDPNHMWSSFFRDTDGRTCALDAPAGGEVQMRALNNRGQVVGHWNPPRGPRHAFIWDKTASMRDLGTFGGLESLACDINDRSQMVGFFSTLRSEWRAFICDPNLGMQELGPSRFGPDATCCINNRGFVVGQFGSGAEEYYISTWIAGVGLQRLALVASREYPQVCGLNDGNQYFLNVHLSGVRLLGRRFGERWESHLWESDHHIHCLSQHLGRTDIEAMNGCDMSADGTMVGVLMVTKSPDPRIVILEPIPQ